jgi:hypothetical protein
MAKISAYYLEHFVVLAEGVVSTVALAANRFVTRNGAYPTLGAYAAGVTQMATTAVGDQVTTTTMGIEVVEVGAAIAAIDTPLMSDANGKARPVTDAATQKTNAYALDTATGSGVEFIRVKLV